MVLLIANWASGEKKKNFCKVQLKWLSFILNGWWNSLLQALFILCLLFCFAFASFMKNIYKESFVFKWILVNKNLVCDLNLKYLNGSVVLCVCAGAGSRSVSSTSPLAAARTHTEGPSDLLLETSYYNFYQPSCYPSYYGNLYNYQQYQVTNK